MMLKQQVYVIYLYIVEMSHYLNAQIKTAKISQQKQIGQANSIQPTVGGK